MSTFSTTKDPDAVLDYSIDWSSWLGEDTISTSAWVVTGPDSALAVDNDTNDTTTATVWLSGGTANNVYYARNRITTAGFRTEDRTITLTVANR